MKLPSACLALLLTATAALAADPVPAAAPVATKPELRGVMDLGNGKRFLLASPGGTTSKWESVGDSFGDWKIGEYREPDRTLVLRRDDGTELDLALSGSPATAGDTKATLADAQALLRKMNFNRMLEKVMDQQKQSMLAMTQKMAAGSGMKGVDPQAFADYQKKVMDTVMSALDPKQMEADTAAIYSDVFTKEQLDGLSDFYDSPSGQAYLDKQPEIQQKMQAAIMPRLMAVMPQVQAMGRDFATQQKAAAAANAGAAGTGAGTSP
jgi:uncharacterized protein